MFCAEPVEYVVERVAWTLEAVEPLPVFGCNLYGGRVCHSGHNGYRALLDAVSFAGFRNRLPRYVWFLRGKHGLPKVLCPCVRDTRVMSSCQGDIPISTKVDREMLEFVESECERLGVSRSEFHRRLLELYRESKRENVDCPECNQTVVFDLKA